MSLTLNRAGFLTGKISSREDVSGTDVISNPENSWSSPVLQERYLNDSQFEAMRVVKAAAVSCCMQQVVIIAICGSLG